MTKPLGLSVASRNSTMKRWMHKNRIEFAAELVEAGRPNWTLIARAMNDLGLRDANGNAPNRHTAMMTWRRVIEEKPLKHPPQLGGYQPVSTGQTAPQVARNQPSSVQSPEDAEARRQRLREITNKRSAR